MGLVLIEDELKGMVWNTHGLSAKPSEACRLQSNIDRTYRLRWVGYFLALNPRKRGHGERYRGLHLDKTPPAPNPGLYRDPDVLDSDV